jgi:hypothetical protein
MDFRTVTTEERQKLVNALRGNAEDNLAILMDRRDTSFVGSSEEVSDDEVISAIQSPPGLPLLRPDADTHLVKALSAKKSPALRRRCRPNHRLLHAGQGRSYHVESNV